jgi:hypothetical protein
MAQMINLFFLLHLIYLFDEHVIEIMDWEGVVSGAVSYVMETGMISSIGTALICYSLFLESCFRNSPIITFR